MAWRLVLRRCPTRSMTVVGDVAQTGSLAGASSWAEVLRPHLGDSWRLEELTVNYRTPAEVMDDRGGGARRGRLRDGRAAVGAVDRRAAVGGAGGRRLAARRGRPRSPRSWAGKAARSPSWCRAAGSTPSPRRCRSGSRPARPAMRPT